MQLLFLQAIVAERQLILFVTSGVWANWLAENIRSIVLTWIFSEKCGWMDKEIQQ